MKQHADIQKIEMEAQKHTEICLNTIVRNINQSFQLKTTGRNTSSYIQISNNSNAHYVGNYLNNLLYSTTISRYMKSQALSVQFVPNHLY